jgi:PhzF family phenazine biosynthesis protein
MPRIPIHVVHAFTDRVFGGNPAAVCLLTTWLPDDVMQAIATENDLSETAFVVREGEGHRIRWFTPTAEVPLCGHATLASGWVLFATGEAPSGRIEFASASGRLTVTSPEPRSTRAPISIDLPALPAAPTSAHDLDHALGVVPVETLARDGLLVAVVAREDEVRAARPDLGALAAAGRDLIVTARGDRYDFVSRYFGPTVGIPEDPVTGAAHCTIAPYWAARLGRARLSARQVSARGGDLACTVEGDRVILGGHAVRYLEGTIEI